MVRDVRIKEIKINVGSLTANSSGLLDVYGNHSINGTIHSVSLGSNTYTATGSIMLYASGADNVNQDGMIIRIRAGSMMSTFFPFVSMSDNQSVVWTAGSVQTTQYIINNELRVVGSGLGNGTSGIGLVVRYI